MCRYAERKNVPQMLSATDFFLTHDTSPFINPLVKCVRHQPFPEKGQPRRTKYG